MSASDEQFARGTDLLQLNEKVTARQVVNVLGRWKSHQEWNEAGGRKGRLDDLRTGDYYEEDLKLLETDFSQPMEYYIARRPQFLNFCERYGLVARWVHTENVGLLPFTDEKLAASIGLTAAELDAEPIDPLAAEAVFDALSGSMAGFVDEEDCDRRRASFMTAAGGFDAAAFRGALGDTRRSIGGVLLFGPGIGVLSAVLITIHWWPVILQATSDFSDRIARNYAADGPAVLLLPGFLVGTWLFSTFLSGFVPAAERGGAAESSSAPRRSMLEGGGARDQERRDAVRRESGGGGVIPPPPRSRSGASSGASGANSARGGGGGGVAAGMGKDGSALTVGGGTAAGGRRLNWQEAAIAKQDQLFLEKMMRKKRGEKLEGEDDDAPALKIDDDAVKNYYAKAWRDVRRFVGLEE